MTTNVENEINIVSIPENNEIETIDYNDFLTNRRINCLRKFNYLTNTIKYILTILMIVVFTYDYIEKSEIPQLFIIVIIVLLLQLILDIISLFDPNCIMLNNHPGSFNEIIDRNNKIKEYNHTIKDKILGYIDSNRFIDMFVSERPLIILYRVALR